MDLQDYQLNYDFYLAEQEMYDSLFNFGSSFVNESAGLISIQEGVKETILKYVNKIMESIQNAWNKFKEIISKQDGFLSKIKEKVSKVSPNFTIENCPEYDTNLVDQLKAPEFNEENMKDLKSKNDFANKYFSSLMKDPNKSLKENIKDSFVKSRSDKKCDSKLIQSMFDMVTKTIPNKISSIENSIKALNKSTKDIEQSLNTVSSAEVNNECVYIYNSILMEADEDNKDEKVTYKDEDGGNNGNSDSKKSFSQTVTSYLGLCADLLSSAMSCIREVFAFFIQTLKHCFGKKDEESSSEDNTKKDNEVKTEVEV